VAHFTGVQACAARSQAGWLRCGWQFHRRTLPRCAEIGHRTAALNGSRRIRTPTRPGVFAGAGVVIRVLAGVVDRR
jgi:hypothetical protein